MLKVSMISVEDEMWNRTLRCGFGTISIAWLAASTLFMVSLLLNGVKLQMPKISRQHSDNCKRRTIAVRNFG
jgi:hypothetical protein